MQDVPRIRPGSRAQIGLLNAAIARGLGAVAGTGPPNIMTTLARHRGLFRRWLIFAGGLMPGGKLPRFETELIILRVALLCASDYEWEHHRRIGAREGLTDEDLARIRRGPGDPEWPPRQAAMIRAADELHADRIVSDDTWSALGEHLDERELIELCMLVGHYEMLAMTLNSCGVQPDQIRRPVLPKRR